MYFSDNPLECDCELRWYRQWIEEEWNEVEEKWLKETTCKDPKDGKMHNIREVPLKDMFCVGDVRDKPSSKDVRKNVISACTSSFAIKKSRFDFADELKVGYVRYKHLTQITIKVQLF